MSFVNKVSKDSVEYDIQDSRIYTLDLGDVTSLMQDGHFQKVVNADEILALAQATEGSITFSIERMPAVCKVIAKGTYTDGGQTTTEVIASLFMQQRENEYTSISVMATASGNVGQVSGYQIEQSISSGGGSGLYKHIVSLTDSKDNLEITLISCKSGEFTSISQLEYTNDNIISYKSFKNANSNLFISLGVRDEYVMWLNGAQIESLGISNFNIVSDSVSEIKD